MQDVEYLKVLRKGEYGLLFVSSNCSQCQNIEDLDFDDYGVKEEDLPENLLIINVDENESIAKLYDVRHTPSLIIVKDGKKIKTLF